MGSKSICIKPFLSRLPNHRPRKSTSKVTPTISAARRSDSDDPNSYCGGRRRRPVDENMIVLRKRIHEMKMIERNYEPPADWMEWEKRYYTIYDSIICDVLGVLQSMLMNTRPSFALGMVALMVLSLPTSAAFVVLHAVYVTKRIVETGIHL
ncbi:xylosyltransferase 1-like [Hibiscus syriacus]|uniref:Xylosyltransferase 1-like n=1 Tax=Hibiscus syriacus TaxID=106335 RepID=A0A6A2Z5U7_HIBSY|nr:uncharacterized protein LOC120150395 [Hibiscus syriacus]KAE8687371.1 xylosyltransferase 1-like [Hibiscus syriacus]